MSWYMYQSTCSVFLLRKHFIILNSKKQISYKWKFQFMKSVCQAKKDKVL